MLAIRMIDDRDELIKALTIIATIWFIYYGLQSFSAIQQGYWTVIVDGKVIQQGYSMSFGYNMLFPTLFFGFRGLMEKKKVFLALFIIGGLEILMLGSRMAAVSVIFFVVCYLFFISINVGNYKKKTMYIILMIIGGIFFFLFYEQLLTSLSELFDEIGFSSRTISRVLNGTLSEDSARDILYLQSWNLITSGGLFGNGFLADRFYLGSYCHNLFLELFIEFGYIGGIILVVGLIYIIYRMLFKCTDVMWKGLFLTFFCCSFFRLLVSYSLWIDNNFWIMLGICFGYIYESKYINKSDYEGSIDE